MTRFERGRSGIVSERSTQLATSPARTRGLGHSIIRSRLIRYLYAHSLLSHRAAVARHSRFGRALPVA